MIPQLNKDNRLVEYDNQKLKHNEVTEMIILDVAKAPDEIWQYELFYKMIKMEYQH